MSHSRNHSLLNIVFSLMTLNGRRHGEKNKNRNVFTAIKIRFESSLGSFLRPVLEATKVDSYRHDPMNWYGSIFPKTVKKMWIGFQFWAISFLMFLFSLFPSAWKVFTLSGQAFYHPQPLPLLLTLCHMVRVNSLSSLTLSLLLFGQALYTFGLTTKREINAKGKRTLLSSWSLCSFSFAVWRVSSWLQ